MNRSRKNLHFSSVIYGLVFAMSFALTVTVSPALSKPTALQKADARDVKKKASEELKEAKRERKDLIHKLLLSVKDASTRRAEDLAEYVDAVVQLSVAYRADGQTEKANQTFDEVFDLYTQTQPNALTAKIRASGIWQYVYDFPESEFEAKFQPLMIATENNSSAEADSLILDAIKNHERPLSTDRSAEKRKMLRKAVEIKSTLRGSDDRSLVRLLESYAGACESDSDTAEAEKVLLRIRSINQNKSDELKAVDQLMLANFYLRNSMISKANLAVKRAEELGGGRISEGTASAYVSTVDAYRRNAGAEETQRVASEFLSIGGDAIVAALNRQVDEMVIDCIHAGSLAKAQALLTNRVKAIDTCATDIYANDWRMRLADVYLALGEDAESKKIFDQVKQSLLLSGGPLNLVIERRQDLLRKFGKLDKQSAGDEPLAKPDLTGSLKLKYGLWAEDMKFGLFTKVDSYDSRLNHGKVVPDKTDMSTICCKGTLDCDQKFSYAGNLIAARVVPNSVRLENLRIRKLNGQAPELTPEVQRAMLLEKIPPALVRPETVKYVYDSAAIQAQPGDYAMTLLNFPVNPTGAAGRFRIFLTDNLRSPRMASLNYFDNLSRLPQNIQIWYDGTRTLQLCDMTGVIYAPNATVQIVRKFAGAIVAKRITCDVSTTISIDRSLIGKSFD